MAKPADGRAKPFALSRKTEAATGLPFRPRSAAIRAGTRILPIDSARFAFAKLSSVQKRLIFPAREDMKSESAADHRPRSDGGHDLASLGTPAFRLYILRHARAAWTQPGQSDFDRALDDEGFAEAEVIAEEAADQGYRPDVIFSSTAVRCHQTAEPFHRTMSEELPIAYVDSLYSGTVDTYAELAFAERQEKAVMIVGHNPMIEEFFFRLVGKAMAETAAPFGYPTAGLAIVDFDKRPTEADYSGACLAGFMAPNRVT